MPGRIVVVVVVAVAAAAVVIRAGASVTCSRPRLLLGKSFEL